MSRFRCRSVWLVESQHPLPPYPPTTWLPLICGDDWMTECSCFNPALLCYHDRAAMADHSVSFQREFGKRFSWHYIQPVFLFSFLSPPFTLPTGGFIFKQWKKRFLLLTAEGSLLVCHDASSPPDQLVLLQSSCEAIVEGKEILDLPKLPSGGRRDCCFALILPQSKYLLLLADTAADCRSFFCTLHYLAWHIIWKREFFFSFAQVR